MAEITKNLHFEGIGRKLNKLRSQTATIPRMPLGLGPTLPLGLQETQEVVAGLLQQDVVVALVRAVGVVVTAEVTKTVH